MFLHHGNRRSPKHNLQIASLLSFVAGIVNVVGFLAVAQLTTNVTGHFAFFVDEIFELNFLKSLIYFLYILSFLLGSFSSNFLVEVISRKNARFVYIIPTLIEGFLLMAIALLGANLLQQDRHIVACGLLFSMGLQNSLVTRISNAIVRTTHLTGLFTDLGIELSQLFFYREQETRKKLFWSIRLRLTIISCFFAGGICGGIFYSSIGLYALILAAATLLIGIVHDFFHLKIRLLARNLKRKTNHSHQERC